VESQQVERGGGKRERRRERERERWTDIEQEERGI